MAWIETDDELIVELWRDAPDTDTVLRALLNTAQAQCVAYLTTSPEAEWTDPDVIPDNWKIALIMQARAVQRSAIAGSDNQVGPDGLTVTVFPMDWTVKNLLRPRRIGRVL